MKRYSIFLISFFYTLTIFSAPIHVDRNHIVIIDTDGAVDDMRAISLLLSRPEITVKAVLLSDGSLIPAEGAEKVSSLLKDLKRDNIPLACGPVLKNVNPSWRQFNQGIKWGKTPGNKKPGMDAVALLSDMLVNTKEKIDIICLGPLTNMATLVKNKPALLSKIERIIWYNDYVSPFKGFNYESDKESADIVIGSDIRLDVISNLNYSNVLFDMSDYAICKNAKTQLATTLNYVHSQKSVYGKLEEKHFRLADELTVLYLLNSELFGVNTSVDRLNMRYNTNYDAVGIKEAMDDMINGLYVSEQNVVFNSFPVNRESFNYDVRHILDSAIARYGLEEWKVNVMTDEFHGHLGVFSIVGAKMGIKAREIFGVGPDMLEVESFTGINPPYSCLTDGIQVSTGATLGMGTIHLSADTVAQPKAIFSYKGRSVQISLKKEYLKIVDADINEGIVKFGLQDDGYWKLVRQNALKYWLEWDRNKIFDITELK